MLTKRTIVLVQFPFADLSQTKLRPAVVLYDNPEGNDVTPCFISSQQVWNLRVGEFILDPTDSEFPLTQLKVASKVRVSRIATLERRLILRRLGRLGAKSMQQLNVKLIEMFQLNSTLN